MTFNVIFVLVLFCLTAKALNYDGTHRTVKLLNRKKRIIKGEDASIKEFPYLVQLRSYYERVTGSCGGTIIGHRYVLSAAHCLRYMGEGPTPSKILIYYGRSYYVYPNEDANEFSTVATYWLHPKYNLEKTSTLNDIAVLKTTKEFVLSDRVRIALLPIGNVPSSLYGITAKTAGWGRFGPSGSLSSQLQKLTVSIISPEDFKAHYNDTYPQRNGSFYFHKNNNDGYGVAPGDSGSGIFYGYIVIGVVSTETTNATFAVQPDKATDVRAHLSDFILPKIYGKDGNFIN